MNSSTGSAGDMSITCVAKSIFDTTFWFCDYYLCKVWHIWVFLSIIYLKLCLYKFIHMLLLSPNLTTLHSYSGCDTTLQHQSQTHLFKVKHRSLTSVRINCSAFRNNYFAIRYSIIARHAQMVILMETYYISIRPISHPLYLEQLMDLMVNGFFFCMSFFIFRSLEMIKRK